MQHTMLEKDAQSDARTLPDGKCTVTDGSTANVWGKDLIAAFWPVEMQSRSEALEWA